MTGTKLAGRITPVVLLAIWQGADAIGLIDLESIPPPSEISTAWWHLATDGPLLEVTGHTVRMFVTSWLLAVVIGTVVGATIGLSTWAARFSRGTVTFLRFVPPPALIPLVIMVLGLGSRGEVFLATYAGVWPVMLNTTSGVAQVDHRLLDAGRTLQLGRIARTTKLTLPAASAMIFVGARVASAICLIVVVAAEIVGIPQGIGYAIFRSAGALRPDEAYAYILWAGVLGMAVNLSLARLERWALAWQPSWQAT